MGAGYISRLAGLYTYIIRNAIIIATAFIILISDLCIMSTQLPHTFCLLGLITHAVQPVLVEFITFDCDLCITGRVGVDASICRIRVNSG